jgi:hypothetical protein
MPKIVTAADLSKFLGVSLGIAAAVAQDTVKLLFRGCERALANGAAGEMFRRLALPAHQNVPAIS